MYSPDGTRVAYKPYTEDVYLRTASLVIADANGTVLQILTYQNDWRDPTGEVVYFDSIVWSPLGDRVAFARSTSTNDDAPSSWYWGRVDRVRRLLTRRVPARRASRVPRRRSTIGQCAPPPTAPRWLPASEGA